MAQIINELANEGNPFGDKVNEYLEKMADDLKNKAPETDKGQNALLDDLAELLYEAWHFEFHDFKNTKYAAPKMALNTKLHEIIGKMQNGKYDN